MFGLLTRIRHGPLKKFPLPWSYLRHAYRIGLAVTPSWSVSKKIGSYGPYKLNPRFAFSNFESWGSRHNRGFEATVEASNGKTCVLDVGAHIGLVSLPLSQAIAENGKVYAFEPATGNQTYLIEHLNSNHIDNVEVITDLVGERSVGLSELTSIRKTHPMKIFLEYYIEGQMRTIIGLLKFSKYSHQR